MTVASRRGYCPDRPSCGGLVDVIDLIPDKDLVIDACLRVPMVGNHRAKGMLEGARQETGDLLQGGDDGEFRHEPAGSAPARLPAGRPPGAAGA